MTLVQRPDSGYLNYEDAGSGIPVVFVHGWGMSGRVWRYQMEALSRRFRVITLDLRGHGRSGTACSCTMSDFADDVVFLFDRLRLRNAVAVGWSMGVQVLLQAFSGLRESLRGMVLVSGTPKFTRSSDFDHALPEVEVKGMRLRLRRNHSATMINFFRGMFAEGEVSPEESRKIEREILSGIDFPGEETALASLAALADADLRDLLPDIDMPVAIVHGGADSITLPGAAGYLAQRLPRANLSIFPGAGHAPFLSDPEAFNALVGAFVQQVKRDDR
jgi:pimeloyl-[acyl-carrier protein] methyl ester esterase